MLVWVPLVPELGRLFDGGACSLSLPVGKEAETVPVVVYDTVEVRRSVVRTNVVWSARVLIRVKVVETEPSGNVTQWQSSVWVVVEVDVTVWRVVPEGAVSIFGSVAGSVDASVVGSLVVSVDAVAAVDFVVPGIAVGAVVDLLVVVVTVCGVDEVRTNVELDSKLVIAVVKVDVGDLVRDSSHSTSVEVTVTEVVCVVELIGEVID